MTKGTQMRVGFIGLGNMGIGMANNLLKSGVDLTVWNRTQAKADELVARGAKKASSPAELTRQVDLVLACLADVATTRQVFLGPDGVIASATFGQVLVDHATVDLKTSKDCHEAASRRRASFLDAPISGGPLGARDATMSIMVGGDRTAFEKVRPVFEMMGKTVRYMGPSGAGTAMKLINQLLVTVNVCAAAEAFLLANKASVDINEAASVLAASWGNSRMVERSAPITAARNFEKSAAPVRNLVKDIGIIVDLSKQLGIALPLSKTAQELMHEARDLGYAEGDISAVLLALEARSGKR
ncbi:MAG: NAD(P)-dependent oxidoreductase [Chloroflexi bacterium]|nr:NAD(P)-dependent oxidoreductase [Chloroflexota bacterium]